MRKMYKAIIVEEDGKIVDTLYKCNKQKNVECNKKNCGGEWCNYTNNKEYAIDYSNSEDMQVNITQVYKGNKLIKETIEYK